MANPIYQTVSATGTYLFSLDWMTDPSDVQLAVYVPAGVTVSYWVDYTLDPLNPQAWEPQTARWLSQPTVIASSASPATATQPGTMNFPATAVRLNVTAISGGSIEFKLVQSYVIN